MLNPRFGTGINNAAAGLLPFLKPLPGVFGSDLCMLGEDGAAVDVASVEARKSSTFKSSKGFSDMIRTAATLSQLQISQPSSGFYTNTLRD